MTARPIFTGPIEELPAADAAGRALQLYENVCGSVAELKTIAEAQSVIAIAEIAVQFFVKVAKNKQLAIDAGELQIRAERRLGEILAVTERNGGAKGIGKSAVPQENRTPTLAELGIDKKLSSRSQRLAAIPAEKFEPMIGEWRGREESESGRVSVRLMREEEKAGRRAAREAELGAKIAALPEQRFGVVVEDFEWHFETRSDRGMDRHAGNHYPTAAAATTPEAIVAHRDIDDFAAADCIRFSWTTAPHLAIALKVIELSGFRYVSHLIWLKSRIITGYWNRGKHELLLISVRGEPVAPAMDDPKLPSWIEALDGTAIDTDFPGRRHSQKPELFLEWIERLWPSTPKIELNRRGPARAGWHAWGNEAEITTA